MNRRPPSLSPPLPFSAILSVSAFWAFLTSLRALCHSRILCHSREGGNPLRPPASNTPPAKQHPISKKVATQAQASGRMFAVALLLCVTLVFASCAQPAPHKTEPITLEFWTLQLDTFKSTLEPMFLAYQREHPNVRIKWVDVPFSEGPKRTLTAMLSGHAPDVVNLNPDFSAILANRNALTDMNQALPKSVKATYLPVAWDAATLIKPGQTPLAFGVPWYITSSVTIYNRSILQKAGYQQPPVHFTDLSEFAEQVRQKAGAYGMMPVIAESGNFLKELKKLGIPLYNAQGKAAFATPPATEALARYVDLYQQGWVPAEAITESHQSAVGRFQAGTLASLSIGPNFLKIVKENAPDIYKVTGVAPQFPQDAGYKDFSLMVLVVPKKSAHPKEAADFAAFITNAKNQLALAQAAPVLPSVTAALRDPYFAASAGDDLMAQGRAISASQLLKATAAYQIQPNQNAINEIMNHYVQLAMLGKLSPENALRRAETEINDTLELGS
ncbi:ABC transporter substrate-binding protein [Vampirovibrio sp.]|uniref:ABC transporter substrate-binding protein n=1 Tax=Vampirovibrio sp. TaxID=2717857 RepID=UPI003594893D